MRCESRSDVAYGATFAGAKGDIGCGLNDLGERESYQHDKARAGRRLIRTYRSRSYETVIAGGSGGTGAFGSDGSSPRGIMMAS